MRFKVYKDMKWSLTVALGVFCATSALHADSILGHFVGTSPCTDAIKPLLQIPAGAKPDLIRWDLTMHRDPQTDARGRYKLRCEHEAATSPAHPNKDTKVIQREGTWAVTKGTKSNPDAIVYELAGAVSLFQLDSNILHVLNPDLSLMIGNGGWSYTLNRAEDAEKIPDRALTLSQPDMSYKISPLATGPTVFGIFEGRSPCQSIARDLKVSVHPGANKAKWRVTLYQEPRTLAPTTYKIEGTLFRGDSGAREGNWSIIRGTSKHPNATIYQLAPTKTQPALFLFKGDDNVLFFLDQNQKTRVGNADFSCTLNRRESP